MSWPRNGITPSFNSSGQYTGLKGVGLGVAAARPVILAGDFGASFNELCDQFGLDFALPVNITGVAPVRGNLQMANGNAVLKFRASDNSMCVAPPGETEGAYVPIADGIFELPSGNSNNKMRVSVTARLLPTTNKQDTLASGTRYCRRPNGSWKYQLSAATHEQMQWLQTFGIGGNQSTDMAKRIDAPLNSGAQLMFVNLSGNDYITGNMLVADSVNTTMANCDKFLEKGISVILQLLPPRYGKDAAGVALPFSGEYTADRQGKLTTGNRAVRAPASLRPGMSIADPSKAIDPLSAQGAIFNGCTGDGKHPAGGLAHYIMMSNLLIVKPMFTGYAFSPNVGAGDYYNAAFNPGGNLLNSNQGAFAGNSTANNGVAAAWAATTVITAQKFIISNGNLYYTEAGGTTGNTAPTHLQGSVTDGSVSWKFAASRIASSIANTPSWATAASVAARTFVISNGNLYTTDAGGVTGATAPSHVQGTVYDGGVFWTFVDSGAVAGIGDGYTPTLEAAGVTATFHTLTDVSGTRRQEVIVRGGATNGNGLRISPSAINGSTITPLVDRVTYEIDVKIPTNPSDCYGMFSDCILAGGLPVIWDNACMQSIQQGMQIDSCRIALEPMVWPTGVTNVQPRFHIQVKANGLTRLSLEKNTLRKVI